MNKAIKILVSGFLVGGILAGCGNANEDEQSNNKKEAASSNQSSLNQEEANSEPTEDGESKELLEVGQKATSQAGTAELLKIKQVNETVDIDPLVVTIKDVKVIKLTDVDEGFADQLAPMAGVDASTLSQGFSYIQVQFTAENTSENNIEWYNLMNVVTDKGEQIDGQMKDFFFDDAESDSVFIGKVKKEYQDGFVVKDEDIGNIKLVFGYSMNSDTGETITEKQTVEYSFD